MLPLLHPDNVLAAFRRLHSELPGLVGEANWPGIQATLRDLQAATAPAERQKLSEKLIDQVESYRPAYLAVQRELKRSQDSQLELEQTTLRGHLQQALHESLTAFCQRTRIPTEAIEPSLRAVVQSIVLEPLQSDERTVLLKPGGIGGARSHKLANLRLAPNDAFELITGAVVPAIAGPTPLVVAFAIWAVIRFLYGATRRELDEEQAAVLWGVILARQGERQTSDEPTIVHRTNQQRQKYGLPALDPKRIRYILNQLKDDRVIRQPTGSPNAWQVAESFVVISNDQNGWQVVDQVLG